MRSKYIQKLVSEANFIKESSMKDVVMTLMTAREEGIDLHDKKELMDWLNKNKEYKTIALLSKDFDKVIDVFMDLY